MNNQTQSSSCRVVVLGAGSIGCYLGGCLKAAGANVAFYGRERLQSQIAEYGLRLTDWQSLDIKIAADDIDYQLSAEVLSDADYVFVTVKSGDTPVAADLIAQHCDKNTKIISFQNGVSNTQVLQQTLKEYEVLKGMVPFNVLSNGNGHFHRGTEGDLALEAKSDTHNELLNILAKAGLPVQVYEDLAGIQWSKLLLNLNNAVNALSGIPLLEQLNDKHYRKVMASIVTEALMVFAKADIHPVKTGKVFPKLMPYILSLPTWLFKRVASAMLKIDPQARSSMYEDLALGRKTEIDFLNGEIVNLAQSVGIDAPINRQIVTLVKRAEAEKNGTPNLKASILLASINR